MINKKSFNNIRQQIKGQNLRIIFFALLAAGMYLGIFVLQQITTISTPVLRATNKLLFVAVTLFCASIISRAGSAYAMKTIEGIEAENRLLISKLVGFSVYIIALIIILWSLGVRADNIALVIGFVATGFALSLRDVILSYLAWFILLRKKPFRIGDTIRIEGMEGRVKHIGTFYVVVDDTPQKASDYMRIPTTLFIQKPITNFSKGPITASTYIKTKDDKKRRSIDSLNKKLQEIPGAQAQAEHSIEAGEAVIRVNYQYQLEEKANVQKEVMQILVGETK